MNDPTKRLRDRIDLVSIDQELGRGKRSRLGGRVKAIVENPIRQHRKVFVDQDGLVNRASCLRPFGFACRIGARC